MNYWTYGVISCNRIGVGSKCQLMNLHAKAIHKRIVLALRIDLGSTDTSLVEDGSLSHRELYRTTLPITFIVKLSVKSLISSNYWSCKRSLRMSQNVLSSSTTLPVRFTR